MEQGNMRRTVSVIIPVYNDPEGIETTLESLTNQEYPNDDYEILVVDNGSTDETPAVIKSFAQKYPPIVALSKTDIQGSYAARNYGIERASGRILAFVDADMWISDNWLESIVRIADQNEYDYFGCDVKIIPKNQPPTLAERYNMLTGFPVEKYIKQNHFAPTCCLVIRQKVVEEVGLFDERLMSGGDKEFGKRVYRNDFSQGFISDVKMYHPARDSFSVLRKKAFRVGRGREQLVRYHGGMDFGKSSLLNPKQYAPPLPTRFYREFSEEGFSNLALILLYVQAYTTIIFSTIGMIYERLFHRFL